MATTTRKRAASKSTRATPKHGANGQFVSKSRVKRARKRVSGLVPDVDFSTRNIALGTAAVAGAAIAGALFAAWRSNAFADLFERDLITGEDDAHEARDVIDDDDRDQFAPATVPLRDSKYDRELAAN
jgi:hypothetical protein